MAFFSVTPVASKVEASKVDEIYQYWRVHLMLSMYLGYGIFYFTRKSLNFAMPAMLEDLGLAHSDFGLLGTLFYITYGLSKFVSGIVSDQSKPSYFMGLGLIATGIINVLFGLSSSLMAFVMLWTLNAFFQGWGWPPCAKLLTSWYSRSERGFWWSLWNTCQNVSGALIPISIGFIAVTYGWRYGFIVPGIGAMVVGLYLCFRIKDIPVIIEDA